MKSINTIILLVIFIWSNQIFAQNDSILVKKTALEIGEIVELNSKILNQNREVNIYLPFGYSPDSSKTYPVIYLLDGSLNEDFLHISGLVQFGSYPWVDMVPESIVVGISNVDRKHDFTYPSKNEQDKIDFPTTGGSSKFIDFIEKELQPFIDSTYNVDTLRTIIGQSLGGLLATEILLKRPKMFDNYIIISPSLWWDEQSLLNIEPIDYSSEKNIYVGVGKEGKVMEQTAKELYNKIRNLKKENTKTYFDYFESQDHGNILHMAAYRAFDQLFSK